MHNNISRKSRHARRRCALPFGAVRLGRVPLGLERLEERAYLAADLPFQNPHNAFDVNNDGYFNRADVFMLINELRLGGERSLTAPGEGEMAEGEVPAVGGKFVDVNGDGYIDRRDVFASIGQIRAEGEQNPTGFPVLMNYQLQILSADGQTEFTDPDGPGPLGITIPKNGDFLIRVFVQDTGEELPGLDRVTGEEGIGTFSLDLGYRQTSAAGAPSTGNIFPTIPDNPVRFNSTAPAGTGGTFTLTFDGQTTGAIPFDADAAAVNTALEGLSNIGAGDVTTTGFAGGPWTVEFTGALAGADVDQLSVDASLITGGSLSTGGNTMAAALVTQGAVGTNERQQIGYGLAYNGGPTPPQDVPDDRIQAIQGNNRVNPDAVTGENFLGLGLILAFEVPFTAGAIQDTDVFVQTIDFTSRPAPFNQTRILATQDNVNVDFPNSQIQDAQAHLSIVDDVFANPDFVILPEQAGPAAAPIIINPMVNDFFPPNKERGIVLAGVPANGTIAIDDRGTALRSDDVLVYTPDDPYFVGVETVDYMLQVFDNPGDLVPAQSRTATITIDLREFNFAPVVSAAGDDETMLNAAGIPLAFDQGTTQTFLATGATGLLTNDIPGDPNDNTPVADDESRPNQDLHIVGDPRVPFNDVPYSQLASQQPFVVPASAGTVSVNAVGNLVFRSSPTFVGTAVIHYFVEDNGFAQSLVPIATPAAELAPAATEATLTVDVLDVTDLARFNVEFFADAAGTVPLNGEVDINSPFFAKVFVTDLRTPVAPALVPPGVANAVLDLQFDDIIGAVQIVSTVPGPADAASITIDPRFAAGSSQAFVGTNLVNNTGGTAAFGTSNSSAPLLLYTIAMMSGAPTTGVISDFVPLFAPNQPAGLPAPAVTLYDDLGAPLPALLESQIEFVPASLLVARGFRPTAVDDFIYVTPEGVTLTVSDEGDRSGAFAPPNAFDATKGVLNNDTDEDSVANPTTNELFGEIVDLSNVTHGILSLEDGDDPGSFIQVTGPGASPVPANWHGTFTYVPLSGTINGTDTFTYRVRDIDGRRSLTPATVTLRITAVPDAPVAIDDNVAGTVAPDRYAVGIAPDILDVAIEGNRTGSGSPFDPTMGVLNNDIDPDTNADPSLPISTTNILTANLLSLPNLGQLTLVDSTGGDHLITDLSDATGFIWTGRFRFVPNAGVRGVTDTFTYEAMDQTGRVSAPATVSIDIDLANISVQGRVVVDDSQPAPGPTPYPNTLGPNGRFDFNDLNGNGLFDDRAEQIERTLGGVRMTLTGFTRVTNTAISTSATSNSAGIFNLDALAAAEPIPAGAYQVIQDPRIKNFFFDGLDSLDGGATSDPASSNNSTAVLDQLPVDSGAADLLFGEFGLRPQFLSTAFTSTSRAGVLVGLDENNEIVWYSIDSGAGWNVFEHEITGISFANNTATLSFTEPDPTDPLLPPIAVDIAVPMSHGTRFTQAVDAATGFKVVHFIGRAVDLKTLYQV